LKKKNNNLKYRVLLSILLLTSLSACSLPILESFSTGNGLSPSMMVVVQSVVLLTMVAGLISLLTFIIPGLTIIWISALIYGLLIGFNIVSSILFALITALMLFGNVVDQLLMGVKAKNSGASWLSIFLSTGAAFIFSILFPPFGGLIAAMVVLMTMEIVRLKDWRRAAQSSKEMALGCVSAVAIRFGIGLIMIGIWIFWVWQSGHWILGS
jgi:uncharacterized protein YqgC (DUF456 family)